MTSPLLVAKTGKTELHLLPALANRHGLITGGTGKTATLQTLAELFSRAGVPVFMADVKGDRSGMAKAGGGHARVAERAFVVPPGSQLGPIGEAERRSIIAASPVAEHYEKQADRESAYEKLKARAGQVAQERTQQEQPKQGSIASDILFGKAGPRGGKQSQGLIEAMAKSAARTVGSQVGRELVRGVLASLLGKRR